MNCDIVNIKIKKTRTTVLDRKKTMVIKSYQNSTNLGVFFMLYAKQFIIEKCQCYQLTAQTVTRFEYGSVMAFDHGIYYERM